MQALGAELDPKILSLDAPGVSRLVKTNQSLPLTTGFMANNGSYSYRVCHDCGYKEVTQDEESRWSLALDDGSFKTLLCENCYGVRWRHSGGEPRTLDEERIRVQQRKAEAWSSASASIEPTEPTEC